MTEDDPHPKYPLGLILKFFFKKPTDRDIIILLNSALFILKLFFQKVLVHVDSYPPSHQTFKQLPNLYDAETATGAD